MNFKGYGRKLSLSNVRYCLGIYLEGLRETTTSARMAILWAEI
jgi:hypothetical protein